VVIVGSTGMDSCVANRFMAREDSPPFPSFDDSGHSTLKNGDLPGESHPVAWSTFQNRSESGKNRHYYFDFLGPRFEETTFP